MENLKEKYELKFLKMDQRVASCSLCCFSNEKLECLCPDDFYKISEAVGSCAQRNSYYIKK